LHLVHVPAQDRRQVGIDDVVSPRPTSFISGETSWLIETWVKPISRAISPARAS
jgi:hypothetical protein